MRVRPAPHLVPITLAALALTACAPAQVSFTCAEGEPLCDLVAVMNDQRTEATGIDIVGVYLYQAVEIPLMESLVSSPVPTTPVVAGRDTLFRVAVVPHEDFQARDLTGRLYFYRDGKAFAAYQTDVTVSGASSMSELDSTFNLRVAGSVLQPGVSWAAEIVEQKHENGGGEAAGYAAWPEGSDEPIEVTEGAELVRVLLVPVQYNADGSGRVPDTSGDMVEFYRQYFWAHYPTAEVEMIVGDQLAWSGSVGAMDTGGWSNLLSAVAESRAQQGADDDMYLYGVFNPSDEFGSFCGGGCIAGLSTVAHSATDAWSRASIGLGYGGETTSSTMVHEIGHAHGLWHAPCGNPDSVDPSFPYDDGSLGVRGYDLRAEALRESSAYYDMMSYCSPTFISDYHFDKLHTRVKAVSDTYFSGGPGLPYWALWAMPDGSLRWGRDRSLRQPPGGVTRTVELLDAEGGVVARVLASWSPFSEGEGGSLSFPAPRAEVVAARVDGELSPLRPPTVRDPTW
ncbi:MAG: M66 family metalloprotease [Pseudomonadota bacterium]